MAETKPHRKNVGWLRRPPHLRPVIPSMPLPFSGWGRPRPHFPALTLAFAFAFGACATAAETPRQFTTPKEAVASLAAAVQTSDGQALRTIFGPDSDALVNPDETQAANEYSVFAAALNAQMNLVRISPNKYVLEVGTNTWPFPVPLVQTNGSWMFDTVAGKDEILNRRIGRNELSVLRVMRAYVEAQREYAALDHDGDDVLEYAQRLSSRPGTKDGLYWPPELDGTASPFGPLVAMAEAEGYDVRSQSGVSTTEPFHGYYFKILKRQGKHAPGGRYDFVINGNMIGGFAMVAWPAEYGKSGVMTFIVNQLGRVLQRDVGEKTSKVSASMKTYDPAPGWTVSAD